MEIVVADSSPLIGLARIGQIQLLQKLCRRVLVPSKVWAEVTEVRADAPGASVVLAQKWIEVLDSDPKDSATLQAFVDGGEAQALVLARPMVQALEQNGIFVSASLVDVVLQELGE